MPSKIGRKSRILHKSPLFEACTACIASGADTIWFLCWEKIVDPYILPYIWEIVNLNKEDWIFFGTFMAIDEFGYLNCKFQYIWHTGLNCEQFFFFNASSKRFLKLWFIIRHKSPLPIIFGVRKQLSHIRFKELQVQESGRLTFQRGFKKQLLMHARRGIYHKTCTHVYVPCLLAAAVCKSIRTHYIHMYICIDL